MGGLTKWNNNEGKRHNELEIYLCESCPSAKQWFLTPSGEQQKRKNDLLAYGRSIYLLINPQTMRLVYFDHAYFFQVKFIQIQRIWPTLAV